MDAQPSIKRPERNVSQPPAKTRARSAGRNVDDEASSPSTGCSSPKRAARRLPSKTRARFAEPGSDDEDDEDAHAQDGCSSPKRSRARSTPAKGRALQRGRSGDELDLSSAARRRAASASRSRPGENGEDMETEEGSLPNLREVANNASMVSKAIAAFTQPIREPGGGKNNIVVAIRVRPFNAREIAEASAQPVVDCSPKSICVKASRLENENHGNDKTFNYDYVFSSHVDKGSPDFATQESVFNTIGLSVLRNAVNAYNGCLLAYGQTGAGKSHSMVGDIFSQTEKGLLPRSCEMLFQMIESLTLEAEEAGSKLEAKIRATYLEIYQEKMFDLLVSGGDRIDLQVRLHPDLGPIVPQLTETTCYTITDIRDLLDFGAKNRAVGATLMNAQSSRSHAVFSVELRLGYTGKTSKDQQSKVHFVDLAGSEKLKKTNASGERLQEGISINQSLTALSRVISALSKPSKNEQPPFRESKLTMLLKDALSGNSRTVLVACVSPSKYNAEETTTTLEFASRCKMIKTSAKKNEENKQRVLDQIAAEKCELEEKLSKEVAQRKALQQKLELESAQTKQAQAALVKMQEEKLEIERRLESERQLRVLERANRGDWQSKEKEIQEAREAQEKERQELDRLRKEFQEEQTSRERKVSFEFEGSMHKDHEKRICEVEQAHAAEEERLKQAEQRIRNSFLKLKEKCEDWQQQHSLPQQQHQLPQQQQLLPQPQSPLRFQPLQQQSQQSQQQQQQYRQQQHQQQHQMDVKRPRAAFKGLFRCGRWLNCRRKH